MSHDVFVSYVCDERQEAAGLPEFLQAEGIHWGIDEERAAGRYPHPFYWALFVASGTGMVLEAR